MRYAIRAAGGAAVLLFLCLTGCSAGGETQGAPAPSGSSPAPSAASASPQDLTGVIDRTRSVLAQSGAVGADAPGAQGLMLVRAWPTGAAYAWETRDQRLCWATVSDSVVGERACATRPLDPPVHPDRGVSGVATLFGNGWGRLFAADHQEVTAATCGDAPLEVRRVGTVADGSRTLYAVWFPDYTRGTIGLSLLHDGATSETRFRLGDAGDRTCGEAA